jgi:hypothetical protein
MVKVCSPSTWVLLRALYLSQLVLSTWNGSYGGSLESYPHPELDFKAFIASVERENKRTAKVWDPVSMRPMEWISSGKLRRLNPHGGCVVS